MTTYPLWHMAGGNSALPAWTSPQTGTVVLGDGFFVAANIPGHPDAQGVIVAHELLHVANRDMSHRQIADALGIKIEDKATDDQVNTAISRWIENGCKN